MDGITPFQHRVYEALCEIPTGKVCTYKALARYLGCGSCQAIGQALRRNPYAPMVPCHRVIRTDRSLGGYYGSADGEIVNKKRELLEQEGVRFISEGDRLVIAPTDLFTFDK